MNKHGEQGLLLDRQILAVTYDWQHILGIEVHIVVPGVFSQFHQLFSSMLYECFVYLSQKILELADQSV